MKNKTRKSIAKLMAVLLSALLFASMPVYAAEDPEQIFIIPEETAQAEELFEDAAPEDSEAELTVPEEEGFINAALQPPEEYVTVTAYNRQDYTWGDVLFEEGYQYPTDASRELRIRGSGTSSNNITIQSVEWLKFDERTGEYAADTSANHVFSAGKWKCILTLSGASSANINDNATGQGNIHFAGFPESTVWQGNGNSSGNIPYYTIFNIEGTEVIENIRLHGFSPEELLPGDELEEPSFTLDAALVSKGISIADTYWLKKTEATEDSAWYDYEKVSPGETVELGTYFLVVRLTISNASCQIGEDLYVDDDGLGVYVFNYRESDTALLVAVDYDIRADKDGIVYILSKDSYDAVVAEDCFDYELDPNLVIPKEVTFGSRTYTVEGIEGAFPDTDIETLTIPATVRYIGNYSFDNCAMLQKVIFEEGSQCITIKDGAFRNCCALTGINLPQSLRRIEKRAFDNCTGLSTIKIPASLRSIGTDAFTGCDTLSKVIFNEGSSLEKIESDAFGKNTDSNPLVIRYYEDDTAAKSIIEEYVSAVRAKGWTHITTKPYPSKYTSIKDCTIAAIKDYVYNGKIRKPKLTITYKGKTLESGVDYKAEYSSNLNVGKAKVTIKGIGAYKDTTTKTFNILPKGTAIKSLAGYSKAVKVNWNVQSEKMSKSRITGYQIQVATNSAFTSGKRTVSVEGYKSTSQKITNLKGAKKYYVRIRTYKLIDGKKYCSPWSKAKTVTTKK